MNVMNEFQFCAGHALIGLNKFTGTFSVKLTEEAPICHYDEVDIVVTPEANIAFYQNPRTGEIFIARIVNEITDHNEPQIVLHKGGGLMAIAQGMLGNMPGVTVVKRSFFNTNVFKVKVNVSVLKMNMGLSSSSAHIPVHEVKGLLHAQFTVIDVDTLEVEHRTIAIRKVRAGNRLSIVRPVNKTMGDMIVIHHLARESKWITLELEEGRLNSYCI